MMIVLTALSLPFMTREPISLPPIVSVELIQITDKTNIPFAPKARKIIDKVKKEEKRVVSEQAPPSAKIKLLKSPLSAKNVRLNPQDIFFLIRE